MWWIFTITFLLFAVTNSACDCQNSTFSDNTLVCNNALERDNSLQLDPSTIYFILKGSSGSIDSKTFALMPKLKSLSIVGSKISYIEDGALCLPKLSGIHIKYNVEFPVLTKTLLSNCNDIEEVSLDAVHMEPNALENMTSLKRLRLLYQMIPHLEPLNNLEELTITDCSTAGYDAPNNICSSPKLERLTIHISDTGCPPLTKSTFEKCNNVKELSIFNGNEHSRWEEHVFSGLSSAKVVRLHFRDMEHITKNHLAGLQNAETLDLDWANVTTIDSDTFDGFNQLKELSLEGSKLTESDMHILDSLPNLEYLNLAHTLINTIDNFRHPKLERIEIRCTKVRNINLKRMKENLPKLKKLYAACTPLQLESSEREELRGILAYHEYPFLGIIKCRCGDFDDH